MAQGDSFVLAHVSDLHVSTFGDTFHDGTHRVRRASKPFLVVASKYETEWEEAGWRVLRERGKRRIVLLDPEGYEHGVPSSRKSAGTLDPVERAARKACRLEGRTARTLARGMPSAGALEHLASTTPNNSNVRLLRAASHLDPKQIDAVFITGDLTDDGAGYELILEAFRAWHERGMLFAVPGNHDSYLFPFFGSERPRPTSDSKRESWQRFEAALGQTRSANGIWSRYLENAGIYLVGLDSCARKQPRFFRQNGAVGKSQMAELEELARSALWKNARHRVVGLHHHVVPLPHGVGKAASPEMGMRLDDATEVAELLNRTGVDLVMHGHRHVSEERKPAGCRFRILASPSFTLGCRSGDGPSFWRVELGSHMRVDRVFLPVSEPAIGEAHERDHSARNAPDDMTGNGGDGEEDGDEDVDEPAP